MPNQKEQSHEIVYSTNKNFGRENVAGNSSPQQLRVFLDKRHRKGKAVTIVEGFNGTGKDLKSLGKELKQRCGVGGTVKNNVILIQGDFRNKITEELIKKGYKVKQI